MPKRKRKRGQPAPEPLVGALAFGNDPQGRPLGADAIGTGDAEMPLRGALLFGNDPDGNPTGADSFGGTDAQDPLRGALLFGNDPQGDPRGADAVGGTDERDPLRGALLFGNDPQGDPRGSEAFGTSDQALQFRGSEAFGAPQLVPDKLTKDVIGYDFGGTILVADDSNFAGIRKDPMDRLRSRVVKVLERTLDVDIERLRHGLSERAIKWGKLRRDKSLDKRLAEHLRRWYQKAPGEVLGIGQVRDVLEETDRMHTFSLRCDWDVIPMTLAVLWGGEPIAYAQSAMHNQHTYFIFKDDEGQILGYSDALVPRRGEQRARVRDIRGEPVGEFELTAPGATEELPGFDDEDDEKDRPHPTRIKGIIRDARGRDWFRLEEQRTSPHFFKATLIDIATDEEVGRIEDHLRDGKVRTTVEVELSLPCALVWALGVLMADLARLRRRGWPNLRDEEQEYIEPIREALGRPGRVGSNEPALARAPDPSWHGTPPETYDDIPPELLQAESSEPDEDYGDDGEWEEEVSEPSTSEGAAPMPKDWEALYDADAEASESAQTADPSEPSELPEPSE